MDKIILIVTAALVILAGWLVAMYNSLIRGKNRVDEAWSDISVQLKRRYDLIPNLVETVKGYVAHEQEAFEKVINARSRAMEWKAVRQPLKPKRKINFRAL
jgi:LemA protein